MHNRLPIWRRVRRDAVPRSMIAACTERRLAGDWRGACEAARVDVGFDDAQARLVEADLRGLAPDLLRWNLPRDDVGPYGVLAEHSYLLSTASLVDAATPVLVVRPPARKAGPQRLRLEVTTPAQAGWPTDLPPSLWHAGHAHLLREVHGGSALRLPRFEPDGAPLAYQRFAAEPVPGDPVSRAEVLHGLCFHFRGLEAMRLAGFDLDDEAARRLRYQDWPRLCPVGFAAEVRRLAERYRSPQLAWGSTVLTLWPGGRVTTTLRRVAEPIRQVLWPPFPPDPDLVWHGLIGADELHPLVREALFPGVAQVPAEVRDPGVRVRCHGVWHVVRPGPDGLAVPHDPQELVRERAMRALGGPVGGCGAVEDAWRTGIGWLPKALRERRAEFFAAAVHGNTGELLAMAEHHMGLRMRDVHGASLLHYLVFLDWRRVLPLLLAAGLEAGDTDRHGRTPLHEAVKHRDADLARALIEAGAGPHGAEPL